MTSRLPTFLGVCGGVSGGVNMPLLYGDEAPELDPEYRLGVPPDEDEEVEEKESERAWRRRVPRSKRASETRCTRVSVRQVESNVIMEGGKLVY